MQSTLTATLCVVAVSAQNPGWTCNSSMREGENWGYADLWANEVVDAAACKEACIDEIAGDTSSDYCCQTMFEEGSSSVSQCNLFDIATADLDIREQTSDEDAPNYSAWAWFAGVEQEDLTLAEPTPEPETPVEDDDDEATEDEDEDEDDEDTSARVVVSALSLASAAILAM